MGRQSLPSTAAQVQEPPPLGRAAAPWPREPRRQGEAPPTPPEAAEGEAALGAREHLSGGGVGVFWIRVYHVVDELWKEFISICDRNMKW